MDKKNSEEAIREILYTAQKMIDGRIDLISGARTIVDLHGSARSFPEKLFQALIGFDSETDNIPVGSQKTNFAREYCEKMDQEAKQVVATWKDDVLQACKNMLDFAKQHGLS